MNVIKAFYPRNMEALAIVKPDHTVWVVAGGLGFREIKESELIRMPGYETPAALKRIMEDDNEVFPFCYFQYGLERYGVSMAELLPLKDYAAKVGRDPATIRQKIKRGTFPYAIKFGDQWLIPAEAPYTDERVTTGEYKDWRKPKDEQKQ